MQWDFLIGLTDIGLFEQSGKLGLQAIAIAGLVVVWRKLEVIEKKREAEWKALEEKREAEWKSREGDWKDRDKQMYDAIDKLTKDLSVALKHHDDFARVAQQERADAAQKTVEAMAREEKYYQALINDRKEWQNVLLQIHRESKSTLQTNTAVGVALVRVLRGSRHALPEVSGRDEIAELAPEIN